MAYGPGKYDEQARAVLEQTDGLVVIVCVVKGNKGHGVSHVAKANLPDLDLAELLLANAGVFRNAADELTRDARKLQQKARGN